MTVLGRASISFSETMPGFFHILSYPALASGENRLVLLSLSPAGESGASRAHFFCLRRLPMMTKRAPAMLPRRRTAPIAIPAPAPPDSFFFEDFEDEGTVLIVAVVAMGAVVARVVGSSDKLAVDVM